MLFAGDFGGRFSHALVSDHAMTTIAVIDDDPTLLDLMPELLSDRSWKMLALRDSDTANDSIRHAMPDAILLDVHLIGGQTGWDVLEALQADPATRSIPVIVWSADSRGLDEKREWLCQLGIPILAKPFDIDDLLRYLDDVLPGREGESGPSGLSA